MSTTAYVFVAIVFLYPVVAGLILRATEGIRMEYADKTTELLHAPDISEDHKRLISSMADDVFDWKFMAYATYIFPKIAFSEKSEVELSESDIEFVSRDDVANLVDLHRKCVMAASPIFTVSFVVVAMITLLFVLFFRSISLLTDVWIDTVKRVSPSVGNHVRLRG